MTWSTSSDDDKGVPDKLEDHWWTDFTFILSYQSYQDFTESKIYDYFNNPITVINA